MKGLTRKENIGLLDRFAPVLVALAFLGVAVSYPPPATGAEPLFGVGSPVSVLFVLPPTYIAAVAGATLFSRRFVSRDDLLGHALAIRSAVAATVLIGINAYVVAVAGFAPLSWFVLASVVGASLVAAVDELAGGFFA